MRCDAMRQDRKDEDDGCLLCTVCGGGGTPRKRQKIYSGMEIDVMVMLGSSSFLREMLDGESTICSSKEISMNRED